METNYFLKISEVLKAVDDPTYFVKSPYFLDLKPYPKQAEILERFYEGNYSELVLVAGMTFDKTFLAILIALYEAF